ncbi:MAG: hypothetical protein AAF738_11425, partial [Bacteroidota bacterium]
MKFTTALSVLLLLSSTLIAQDALWQNLNNSLYYLGNIAIGTPVPTERLQVDGNVRAKAFYTPNIVFGSQTPELAYQNAVSTIGTYRASQSLYLQSPNDLFFHTGILEDSLASMTILRNGNVGIGTDTPITNFHVAGIAQFDGLTRLNYLSPIAADSAAYRALYLGTPNEYFGGWMHNLFDTLYGDGDDFAIFAADGKDLVLHTDDDSKTIIPNGRLGVGTFRPRAKLHVAGDIYSTTLRSGYLYPINSNAEGNYKHIRFGDPDEYYAGFMWNRNSTSFGD